MKRSLFIATVMIALVIPLMIASTPTEPTAKTTEPAQEWMMVTTIESVVPGKLGRSRMLITTSDGESEEKDMQNLFSMVGIKMENLKENSSAIVSMINQYTGGGWELYNITTGVYGGNDAQGIFLTRYYFRK